MILSEIIKIMEREYPKSLAYEWDNVGLLAGRPDSNIKTVLLTLDVTPAVVSEAVACGAELIISHHPLIFSGIKSLAQTDWQSQMYAEIIKNDIAVYSAHTNLDTAERGINAYLAELFSLSGAEAVDKKTGLGRIGNIEKTDLASFCAEVKEKLSTPFLRVVGNMKKTVGRVAIGSGACSELIPEAISQGADVLLTADVKYHTAIDAEGSGIAIIDAGHYPTEIVVMDILEKLFKNTGLNIKKSKNKDIFSLL